MLVQFSPKWTTLPNPLLKKNVSLSPAGTDHFACKNKLLFFPDPLLNVSNNKPLPHSYLIILL